MIKGEDARSLRESVGDWAREQRERRRPKISQRLVAEAVGITQATLSNYESGQRDIPLPIFMRLCRFFEIDFQSALSSRPDASD